MDNRAYVLQPFVDEFMASEVSLRSVKRFWVTPEPFATALLGWLMSLDVDRLEAPGFVDYLSMEVDGFIEIVQANRYVCGYLDDDEHSYAAITVGEVFDALMDVATRGLEARYADEVTRGRRDDNREIWDRG